MWELSATKRLYSDIQLDTVAGVHDQHCIIAPQSFPLGCERLARNARDTSCMNDEGHDSSLRGLDLSGGPLGCNSCQNGGRLRHGDHALPLIDAISAISVPWPVIRATNSWSMA